VKTLAQAPISEAELQQQQQQKKKRRRWRQRSGGGKEAAAAAAAAGAVQCQTTSATWRNTVEEMTE
jgi:hypothetical protein